MASVKLNHIYKVYENGTKAVSDFNMEIKDKEFIVFVGPSGCGKSTTLRMIAGLEEITAGDLFIDNKFVNELEPKDRDVTMVFQNYALYPHMTVYDNMAFGLKIAKVPNQEIDERVHEAAKILDIEDYLQKKPREMSGGQRQRVALGRAIVRHPKVFLLDEPLSNLDAKLRATMRTEILKLHNRLQTTFIYVTHDQIEAMTMSDRLVVMNKGRIMQIGTPKEVYNHPNNLFVATFIGSPSMNILEAKIVNDDLYVDNYLIQKNGNFKIKDFYEERLKEEENYLLSLKDKMDGLLLEDETKIVNQRIESVKSMLNEKIFNIKLGIRPEDIVINHGELICKIDTYELINEEYQIYATFNENKIMFKSSKQVNEEINFEFKKDKIHLFDNIYERAF